MNKARILIVDDGTAGAGDLGGQLVELGYEPVGHTTRGAEAILLAGQLRPDLVLMDISLAGEMNSLAAAQAIHDQFALPVVFLTRFVAEEVMDHAQLAEPFGYLSKPFDRGKLRMVIEMAIYKQSVERQYQARGEWHRSILQKAMDGFWLTDPQGRLLEVNETYCQMSGYSAPELLAMRISDLEAVETAAVTALRIQKIMAQGADRFESRHRRKDGSLFEVEVSVQYQPANGRRLVVFLRDITARKQAEESLRLDNQIMAHMADGVYLIRERDGVIVYTNDRFEKMFGYAPGELLGQPGAVVNAPTPQPPEVTAQAIIAELGRTGVWEGEIQNRKKDGSTFWCQARVSTFVHGSYGPVWVALHQDITSRKLAEEELRVHQMEVLTQNEELRRSQMELDASRARYFDLFDLAPVGYVTIGKRGLILENNLTAARLLGVARGALIRKPFSRFIFKEDSDSYLQLRKQLFDTSAPQTCDLRMVRSDGPPFWVHLAATAAQDAAGAPVCRVTLSDNTARKQAEAALRLSDEALRRILSATRDGYWCVSARGDLLEVNPRYVQQSGYSREELLGMNITDLDPQVSAAFIEANSRRTAEQGSDQFETIHRRKDGTTWHVEASITCSGVVGEKFFVFLRDITERKQAEAALAQSAERHAAILHTAMDGFWLADPQGHLLEVNETYCQMSGYSAPELLTMRISDLEASETSEATAAHLQIVMAQGADRFESRHHRKDGSLFEVEVSVQYQPGDGGRLVTFLRDITQRKQAEVERRESETKFRLLTENIQDVFWLTTPAGDRMLYVSPAFENIWGRTCASLYQQPRSFAEAIHSEDRERLFAAMQEHAQDNWEVEYRILRPDGTLRWILDRAFPIRDERGAVTLICGVAKDITERKQAEAALHDANWRMASIIEGTHVGTWEWNIQTGEAVFNEVWAEMIGYTLEELAPISIKTWQMYVHPEDGAQSAQLLERHFAGERPYYDCECRMKHKAGHWVWVRDRGRVITRNSAGQPLMMFGTHADITTRKQAEEKLRELSIAVEQSPASIVITDPAGNMEYVNPKFLAVTGYTLEEVLGKNPRVLKSGETSPEAYRELWQTITAGQEWRGEFHNQKKTGELFWESVTISPIRDSAGRITHYVAVKEDISARKQAEAERSLMELQLRQAQKLESIGQLAAGIAHEINTPTQYIGDNTRFLQDAFKDITQVLDHYARLLQAARQQQVTPELIAATTAAAAAADITYLAQEVPKSIEQTLQGVAHVAKIVRAMKDFSHPGSEAKVPTDLNHAIESTVTVAHNEWKYVADLDLVLDPQLPRVSCLPGELNQVILNLVINAAHAIGDVVGDGAGGKGRIRVSTSRQGDWAEIRVQDSGTGIPEAVRGRIFDPFFTTKAVGKGTGQGLTIAHLVVVKQHGGTIEFETALGKGTTFIVRLPFQPSPALERKV